MAETTRITSLNMLLDTTGKMLLAEEYGKVIENVQKNTISGKMKNTELSGDPSAGTVEAKRFANATSKNYGTARGASKGDGLDVLSETYMALRSCLTMRDGQNI